VTLLAIVSEPPNCVIFADRRMSWVDRSTGVTIARTETTDPRWFQSGDLDELGKPHIKVWAHPERCAVWATGGTTNLFYRGQWREASDVILDFLSELPPEKQLDLDELIGFVAPLVIERGHRSVHLIFGTPTWAAYAWFPERSDQVVDVEQIEGGRIYASPDTEPYFANRLTATPPVPGRSLEQIVAQVRPVLEDAIAYAHKTVGVANSDVGFPVDIAAATPMGARILEAS
jgi:hypothetical protein